ncbi:MAG: hypothetical protein HOE79_07225 [Euryarchaeota archaeon]|nr:hypothetical protein [Euryarchaeota archaeon]
MVGGTSGRFVPKKPSVATEFPEILNQWNDDSDPSLGAGTTPIASDCIVLLA